MEFGVSTSELKFMRFKKYERTLKNRAFFFVVKYFKKIIKKLKKCVDITKIGAYNQRQLKATHRKVR